MDFGSLIIDVDAHEVYVSNERLDLTPLEFALLAELARRPRVVRSPRELFECVWAAPWLGDDHVVESHVSRLRRKLGESAEAPRFITTIRGIGYRFETPHATPEPVSVSLRAPLRHPDGRLLEMDVELILELGDPRADSGGQRVARLLEARLHS